MSEDQLREIIRQEIARYESQRRTRWTALMRSLRQAVLMVLGALEDHEGMQRSVQPRRDKMTG